MGADLGRRWLGSTATGLLALAMALPLSLFAACHAVAKTECNDGVDNDADGLVDDQDPGCEYNHGAAEHPDPPPPRRPQCSDDVDNDGDGEVDFPHDPGCEDAMDDDESDPPPACSNSRDDDGDGWTDFPYDPGC